MAFPPLCDFYRELRDAYFTTLRRLLPVISPSDQNNHCMEVIFLLQDRRVIVFTVKARDCFSKK